MKRIPPFRNRRDVFYLVHKEPTKESENGIYIVKPKDNSYRAIWAVLYGNPIKLISTSDGYTKEEIDINIEKIENNIYSNKTNIKELSLKIETVFTELKRDKADKDVVDALQNGIIKQPSVETYSDLLIKYPNPELGWDVLVKEGNTRYNWNGSQWVNMETGIYDSQVATKDEIAQLAGDVSQKLEEISITISNEIINGDYSNDIANWSITGGTAGQTISSENGFLLIKLINEGGWVGALSGKYIEASAGDKFYLKTSVMSDVDITDVSTTVGFYQPNTISYNYGALNANVRKNISCILNVDTDGTYDIRLRTSAKVGVISWGKTILINLTKSLGAGNEPTEEEMDLLISTLGIDYFEGEITIPAQKIMQWQLKNQADLAQLGVKLSDTITRDKAFKKSMEILPNKIVNGKFEQGLDNWVLKSVDSYEVNNGELSFQGSQQGSGMSQTIRHNGILENDVIFACCFAKCTTNNLEMLLSDGISGNTAYFPSSTDFVFKSLMKTVSRESDSVGISLRGSGGVIDATITKPLMFNVSEYYGRGNEPSKEYIENLILSLPDQWYEFNYPIAKMLEEYLKVDSIADSLLGIKIKNELPVNIFGIDSNWDGVADNITVFNKDSVEVSMSSDSKIGDFSQRIEAIESISSISIGQKGVFDYGDKYYQGIWVKTNVANAILKLYTGSLFKTIPIDIVDEWVYVSSIMTATKSYFLNKRLEGDIVSGSYVQYDGNILVNLSKAFGYGEEPNIDSFNSLLDKIPNKWYTGDMEFKYILRCMIDELSVNVDLSDYVKSGGSTKTLLEVENSIADIDLSGKVDKVDGYGLIKNTEKDRLAKISDTPPVPYIGENGNWWVEDVDTGKPSRGQLGNTGDYIGVGDEIDTINNDIAQLRTNVSGINELNLLNANGEVPIAFKNYLGNIQNMHPKVLVFPNLWNGYKYWMGYTPYPYGNIQQENPCIAVSNDKINWVTPEGLTNPLDDFPGEGVGTNSDTHLVYIEDTGVLELWWRTYNMPNTWVTLFRRTSTDGINWTPKEAVYESGIGKDVISPAIIFEDGKYKMWSVSMSPHKIQYCETASEDMSSWTDNVPLDIDFGSFTPWHMDIERTDIGYEIVVSERTTTDDFTRDVFHLVQNFDGTFTKPKRIIKVSSDPYAIDNVLMYRPCLIKEKGVYYIYYSFQDKAGRWGLSLSYGTDVQSLKGIEPTIKSIQLNDGDVLDNFVISGVDTLILPHSGTVTINSFEGAKVGQRVRIIATSSRSKAVFNYSSELRTPENKNVVILDIVKRVATVDFIQYGSEILGFVSF